MKSTPSTIVPNEFGTSADKIEPSTALESAGYLPAQQLPAEHMNWFMSLLTRLARSDNPSLRDVWSELNTVLAAAGLSPDNTTVAQLKAALDTLYLLRSLYGTGWENVIKTALGSDWATALAATAGSGILTELKKVDGSGSGLDADTVDGEHASSLHALANVTGLGGNWAGVLAAALGSNWSGTLGTALGTGWPTALSYGVPAFSSFIKMMLGPGTVSVTPGAEYVVGVLIKHSDKTLSGVYQSTSYSVPSGYSLFYFVIAL